MEVATVDHTLHAKLRRLYRKTRRKPKGLKRLWAYLLNIPHLAVIITAVVFVVVVIMWSLLWVFICKWKQYLFSSFVLVFLEIIYSLSRVCLLCLTLCSLKNDKLCQIIFLKIMQVHYI